MLIEFTKDFTKVKKGTVKDYDGSLAINLINMGVAKKHERKPVAKKATKKDE